MVAITKVAQVGSDLHIELDDRSGVVIPLADVATYIKGHDYLPPQYQIASMLKDWQAKGGLDIKTLEGQAVTVAVETKAIEVSK